MFGGNHGNRRIGRRSYDEISSAGMAAPIIILLVILASVLAGMVFSLLLGIAAIQFKADQTLVGTALNLLGPAAAVVLVRAINMAESVDNVSSTVAYGRQKRHLSSISEDLNLTGYADCPFVVNRILYCTV